MEETQEKSFQAAMGWFELAYKLKEDRQPVEARAIARKALECCPDDDTSGLRSRIHAFLEQLK
jgi:hypothetical protein